jgi:hypothetical protein
MTVSAVSSALVFGSEYGNPVGACEFWGRMMVRGIPTKHYRSSTDVFGIVEWIPSIEHFHAFCNTVVLGGVVIFFRNG